MKLNNFITKQQWTKKGGNKSSEKKIIGNWGMDEMVQEFPLRRWHLGPLFRLDIFEQQQEAIVLEQSEQ